MPMGKGTYSKPGRPSKAAKARGKKMMEKKKSTKRTTSKRK